MPTCKNEICFYKYFKKYTELRNQILPDIRQFYEKYFSNHFIEID